MFHQGSGARQRECRHGVAMNDVISSEIIVAGTGPSGMIAALAMAEAGFKVLLAGPQPRRDDRRTVALMRPAVAVLDRIGVLARVADRAEPLSVMRIVDATTRLVRSPVVTFR